MTPRPRWALARRLRLRSPCLVLFAGTLALLADTTGVLRIGILCALLHECGHIAVFCLLLRRPPVLEVSLAGVCLSMRGVMLPPGRMLALAAGMLAWMDGPGQYGYFGMWFAATHLLVGGFNLLPLPGLDGWQIAASLRALAGRRRP